jgi:hypothetical protein
VGMMGVSTKILKSCNALVSKPLPYICNKSIQTGVFPDRLKNSIVKPLYKNGDRSGISNYRPVSLSLVFSKIEKTLYCRLNQHLSINNTLATEKCGFRKDRSREQAAYTLIRVLISSWPDLLPDVFYLMVRIFRLMLVLLYVHINSTSYV